MLSPGKYHLSVPKTLIPNLRFRKALLELAENDVEIQQELWRMCREDIIFYTDCFVWQFNPSKANKGRAATIEPFILFPIQERVLTARPETHAKFRPYDRGMLWCYENEKTMVIEKSRWQGASWLQLIFQDWLCIFHDNVQTLNISRNEGAVDDGTRDSLFWKVRHMHEHLPRWILGDVTDTKLYFHFHRTGSEATGTATTKKAGVGGRASLVNVDEFPEIERAQEVREKTALTTNCRIFTGTHLGVGTTFHTMCDPRQSPEIIKQRMHWTEHPEQARGMYQYDPKNPTKPIIHDKTFKYPEGFQFVLDGSPTGGHAPGVRSPWYDAKCVDIGDSRAIASNLDISPEGSAKQFFDGLKIRNIITECAREPVWVGEIEYDREGKFTRLIEDKKNGRLKLWVHPKDEKGLLPQSRYCIGADIAAGTGATPSAAAGIDGSLSMKVFEYVNPFIEEREFAQMVVALCNWLTGVDGNGAYLVWDSSGQQGTKFENEISRLGYTNIYYNDDDLPPLFVGRKARRPGWYSSAPQKYAVLKDYRQSLYDHTLLDRSENCLLETLLFEYDQRTGEVVHGGEVRTNDPSGARKNHGDLVTATAICWMLAKEMAEGGRRAPRISERPQPGTLEWLLALEEGRRRQLEMI